MKPINTTDRTAAHSDETDGTRHVDADTARERLARAAERLPVHAGAAELGPDLETLAEYQGEAAEAGRDKGEDDDKGEGPRPEEG